MAGKNQNNYFNDQPAPWNQGEFLQVLVSTCWGGCSRATCSSPVFLGNCSDFAKEVDTWLFHLSRGNWNSQSRNQTRNWRVNQTLKVKLRGLWFREKLTPFLWSSHSRYSCVCFSLESQPPKTLLPSILSKWKSWILNRVPQGHSQDRCRDFLWCLVLQTASSLPSKMKCLHNRVSSLGWHIVA